MKKWTSWVLALLMVVSVGFVSGCQKSATSTSPSATNAEKSKHIPSTLGKGLEKAVQNEKGTPSQPANGAKQDTNTAQPNK